MNENDQKKFADQLKQSLKPMKWELDHDLWPKMLRRLDAEPPDRPWLAVLFSQEALSSVPWFDWALLAVFVASVCAFPKSIPIWLYHF